MDNRGFFNEDLDRIEVVTDRRDDKNDIQLTTISCIPSVTPSTNDVDGDRSPTDSDSLLRNHKTIAEGVAQQWGNASLLVKVAMHTNDDVKASPLPFSSLDGTERMSTPTNMTRRWSQSITRYSKERPSLKEKTVYRVPPRKIFEIDGKLQLANNCINGDNEWDELLKEIEQHDYLMQDTVLSRENRRETLRALPQPLAIRRLLKQQLSTTIENQGQQDSERKCLSWKHMVNLIILVIMKTYSLVAKLSKYLEIWYKALKTIEGHFGSNVSSYFKFLRWLLILNLVVSVCTISFIVLPQVISDVTTESKIISDRRSGHDRTFKFIHILTGENALRDSLLFYGGYSNATFRSHGSRIVYSLPYAYYLTMMLVYLVTFVVISTSMARSYRTSFIETSGSLRSSLAPKVFCSWDYGISDYKAAELKHLAIFTELKQVITEIGAPKYKYSLLMHVWIMCLKVVTHLLVLAMIAGLGVGLLILLRTYEHSLSQLSSSSTALGIALFVNSSLIFLQTVFSWISKVEDYNSPRRAMHITLIRNFLLETVVIVVLVYFWMTKNYPECWETVIGQEIYRLVASDFFISLLLLPLVNCLRVFVLRRLWKGCEQPQFDVCQKSLNLVYNQTLLWVGLLFAPLIAPLVVVKMIITFYVQKAMLLHVCKSPRHVWRLSQTHTLYLVFIFLSLLGVIIALGYIITQVPVSPECGPFGGYSYIFQTFIEGVLDLRQNPKLWTFLMMLIRPAVVGILLIIMTIMVYYLREKSRAHCTMVKLLKDMLLAEAKDKEFLLASITNITKGREWLIEAIDNKISNVSSSSDVADAEKSNTWRYSSRNAKSEVYFAANEDPKSPSRNSSATSTSSAVSVDEECRLRSRNI